jgi:protein SCO1/2
MSRLLSLSATAALTAAALTVGGVALADDPHAHHHHHMSGDMTRAQRTTATYTVPQVDLVRDDGKTVSLPAELDDGRPVVLDFIFTTCTTICPVLSSTFGKLQEKLGADAAKVHMVSISIDPEEDTPARLRDYAKKFSAGKQWQHYTGTVAASVALQKAFDAYRGDKMSHDPLTLIRAAPGSPWLRVEGLASADELLVQYRAALTTAKVASR